MKALKTFSCELLRKSFSSDLKLLVYPKKLNFLKITLNFLKNTLFFHKNSQFSILFFKISQKKSQTENSRMLRVSMIPFILSWSIFESKLTIKRGKDGQFLCCLWPQNQKKICRYLVCQTYNSFIQKKTTHSKFEFLIKIKLRR